MGVVLAQTLVKPLFPFLKPDKPCPIQKLEVSFGKNDEFGRRQSLDARWPNSRTF